MTVREKMLSCLFCSCARRLGIQQRPGVNESTVAICVMALMLVLKIVTWDDVIKNKGGWNTLIWYGGIIGLSSLLSKVGFFVWLAEALKNNISFDGHGNVAFIVIVALSILVRYFFASGSAYIVAMVRSLPCWRMFLAHR
jgi:DASS family divalent anion:Na+ symporter